MSTTNTPTGGRLDLERCAQEPIHVIGSIQPHGVLFALSEPDLVVRQVSTNVFDFYGITLDSLLGKSFEMVLGGPNSSMHSNRKS